MKKLLIFVVVAGLLGGPLSSISSAGVACDLQEKLGVNNVKECEDYLP
ncbi:MAG: hypothetical protein ACRDQ2_14180 [Gaiellales bacterium]